MKKSTISLCLLLMVAAILNLLACQKPQSYPMLSPLETPLITPTAFLQPERAALRGRVVSAFTNTPLQEVPVRLAKVYREGDEAIFVLDAAFSPGSITNRDGYFSIADVEPGEYVIIVGNPEGLYEIVSDSSGKAKVWHLTPNQLVDVGVLRVKISP